MNFSHDEDRYLFKASYKPNFNEVYGRGRLSILVIHSRASTYIIGTAYVTRARTWLPNFQTAIESMTLCNCYYTPSAQRELIAHSSPCRSISSFIVKINRFLFSFALRLDSRICRSFLDTPFFVRSFLRSLYIMKQHNIANLHFIFFSWNDKCNSNRACVWRTDNRLCIGFRCVREEQKHSLTPPEA